MCQRLKLDIARTGHKEINMSWDKRERGGKRGYFYRSIRRGNRVVRVYLGRGPEAEEAARQIEQRRRDQQAQREGMHAEITDLGAADQCLRDLQEAVHLIVSAMLTGAGYYKRRGEWRKQRQKGEDTHDTDH